MVECHLAKVKVASPNLVSRSKSAETRGQRLETRKEIVDLFSSQYLVFIQVTIRCELEKKE